MTLFSSYSLAMEQFGWAGWLASGVMVYFLIATAYWMIGKGRAHHYLAKFRRQVQVNGSINPLDKVFSNRRIRVTDLAPPIGGLITGRSFVDCEIVGPVSAVFFNCDFRGNNGEGVDAVLLHSNAFPKNGFAFEHCTFTRCNFYLVTFMVPPTMKEPMMGGTWSGLNWIDQAGVAEIIEQRARAEGLSPQLPQSTATEKQP